MKNKILRRIPGKAMAVSADGKITLGKVFPGTDHPWLLSYPVGFGGGQENRRFSSQRAALIFLNDPMFGGPKFVVRSDE